MASGIHGQHGGSGPLRLNGKLLEFRRADVFREEYCIHFLLLIQEQITINLTA